MSPAVAALNLTKKLGDKSILNGLSMVAEPGDVVGVLGKNGAGKTTLLDILLGFSAATSGNAQIFGSDSFTLPGSLRARIGFVPQQDELIDILTGSQQLALTASFYRAWDRTLCDRLQAAWEIPMDRRIINLSVGERQKLSTLLALGHRPDLLVLDEPVASLDPIARRQLIREIINIADAGDRTVLFASHIVSDLERVTNKVWILKDGALLWQGSLDTLKETVVRLHIQAAAALPATLNLPNGHHCQVDGTRATITVSSWAADQHKTLTAQLGADIEVEAMSLEEIFMELHA